MRPAEQPQLPDTAPPLLVGRDREQALLRDHFAAALVGHGSLLLIGGEAGIGKTALAEAICREASEQGALVLIGRCYDLTETPPYGPWVDLIAAYSPCDGEPPLPAFARGSMDDGVESQAALFQQVLDFFTALAADRPLLLLLDDLHWADPASLDLLRVIARNLSGHAILLLVAYRSDELTRQHPLYQLLPRLERESAPTRLDLRRLPPEAIRALVAARYSLGEADTASLASYLHARADGNAFFVTQLLRALEEEGLLRWHDGGWRLGNLAHLGVPLPLRQVIDGRLARLGEQARARLAVASVIGQDVPLDVWQSAAEADEEVLATVVEQAMAAHLLEETPSGDSVRFVHALVRAALYEGIAVARRRIWHRRVGETLARAPSADPDTVAYHFQQAGDARARAWLMNAGTRAERAYAALIAADRFAAAAELLAKAGPEASERGWLLLHIAWLRRWTDPEGGLVLLEEADRLASEAGDRTLADAVLYHRGIFRCRTGDFRGGIADQREAIRRLESRSDADAISLHTGERVSEANWEHHPLGTLAMWLGYAGYYDEAATLIERLQTHGALNDAAGEGQPTGDYNAYYALGFVAAARGDPDTAIRGFAQSSAVNRVIGNLAGAVQALLDGMEWALLPYRADCIAERERQVAEMEAIWALTSGVLATDDPPHVPRLPVLFLEGRWREARHMCEAIRATHGPTRRRFLATRVLGYLARAQGDADLAWATITEALPAGLATEPGEAEYLVALTMQRLAAALALDAGALPDARAWLTTHDRWLAWSGGILGRSEEQALWARYYRALGEAQRAYEAARQALAHATAPRQPLALLAAHRLLGELDTSAGRRDAARQHLDAALLIADACAALYERALTLIVCAALCAASGNRAEAITILTEARAICTPLDAKPALARLDALAASLDAASAPAPIYPDGMTAREVEVLRLIAAGMSNREMAAKLFVSVRTIERHIENLYRKINARSKAEATAYAFRHNLT